MRHIFRGKVGLGALTALLCLVILSGVVISRVAATEPQTPATPTPVTYANHINRTLTIGDVTVELHRAHHSGSTLEVHHSYSTGHPSGKIYPMLSGYSVTRTDGNLIESRGGAKEQPEIGEAYLYDIGIPLAQGGEHLDISAGSYIIPAPEITATALIEFDPDFAKSHDAALSLPGATKPLDMPTNLDFQVGDGQYRIEKITVFPIEFRMEIVPVNAAAKKIDILVGGVTLEDDTGGRYLLKGGRVTYDDENPRGHVREQYIFSGIIPDSTKSLTMTFRGGNEIVGPFIFEDVHVSYETIKPPPTATPAPTSTPVPTATPEPTPTPTPIPSLAVQNLRAEVVQGAIMLTWDAPDSDDVLGYEILRGVLRSEAIPTVAKLDSDASSYVDSKGLQSDVGYIYIVRTIAYGVTEGNEAYTKVWVP